MATKFHTDMNINPLRNLTCVRLGFALLFAGCSLYADNLTTTVNQGSGANWNAAIWKTNGVGTSVSPVAGNTYETVFNGVAFGNTTANTRIRNPATAGLQTFPGDWLKLGTNTELRMKQAGAILNFPGVGGNPGLILDGGILNAGDDAVFEVQGKIQVASQSYIAPGDQGGGALKTARGVRITGDLSGSGTMVIFQAATNVAQEIGGTANTFSGEWIVKAGRLLGSQVNSLGTNNITIDPNYVLPLDPGITDIAGPAVLEPGYDLNSAGTLNLINGGTLLLHQNCYFRAVNIEGTLLSSGKHTYAELLANFPNNILEGGSGSITVQPYIAINPPGITAQPIPQQVYAGRTARFTVGAGGAPPITYKWRKNGVNLADGANISGSTSATLIVSGVSTADAGTYDVVVSNGGGSATSSGVALAVATPTGEAYETALLAANPYANYRLEETANASTSPPAFDFVGGYVGTYGVGAQTGVPGPALPGFSAGNKAAKFVNGTASSRIVVSPWNLNTNTVTMIAWISPTGVQAANSGIVFCRGGGTTAGLSYSGSTDASGNYTLGYNWNNQWETWSWNSGLVPPTDKWSMVALVVTPTAATLHLLNDANVVSASRAWTHVNQSFSGTTLIGGDSNDNGSGTRSFNGSIGDVAVFNRALSPAEIAALYSAGSGVTAFPLTIAVQPAPLTLYAGQTATFTVAAGGVEPVSYQWQFNGGNLADNARISGATTPRLTIRSLTAADAGDYTVKVSAGSSSLTSNPGNLVVSPTYPAETISLGVQQAAGTDWDNAADWSDYLAVSDSAAQKPGSTYQLLPGSRMRTPLNPSYAVFPGDVLTVQGDGIWTNNPGADYLGISEIRFKQPNPGTVFFKKLAMNGGQLDTGNDNVVGIDGRVDIQASTPIYNDSGNDRGVRIDAWLTGSGNIEYRGYNATTYNPSYVNNLNITGNSNTFSGKWNVVVGTLLGTGLNSLGTNDITVGPGGALETTYDINNPNASLVLNGQMFLHQNDTFKSVMINGKTLAPGAYTFAQLSTTYSNNFPVTWKPQTGAGGYSSGSGSLTVVALAPPVIVTQPAALNAYVGQTVRFSVTVVGGEPLSFQWRSGANGVYSNLADGSRVSGSTTTNLTISNLAPGDAADYVVVITNPGGTATSAVAKLTVQPTSPAQHITIAVQQPTGVDWDNGADWSDGLEASVSAMAKPGSTYEVLPGARLRSPDSAASAVFPGDLLTVSGDGVWANNPASGSTLGEFRFKQSGDGSVTFKKLVLNGGQLDTGNDGLLTLNGQIDVPTNSSFNNNSSNDRGFLLAAWLTGSGNIEYHAYQAVYNPAYINGLVVAGTSNTFSGKWNVAVGNLIGVAPGALGTNDITVGVDGALQTTYDIKNYTASLTLDGQMFLHQNDTFSKVTIAGTALAEGTYTFAQLNAAYPANFPATWTAHSGAGSFRAGSGSITVWGTKAPPVDKVRLEYEYSPGSLKLTWSTGFLLEADSANGPWLRNNASSPYTVPTTAPQKFYRVQLQ